MLKLLLSICQFASQGQVHKGVICDSLPANNLPWAFQWRFYFLLSTTYDIDEIIRLKKKVLLINTDFSNLFKVN